jgi:hypothetical protein
MSQDSFCPVTGDYPCKCDTKLAVTPMGTALMTDVKAALRKLFDDHVDYTNLVIMESVPMLNPYAKDFIGRLLKNPTDIANLLVQIKGVPLAAEIKEAFTEHLKLAAATLEPVRNGNGVATEAVKKFKNQGNILAGALSKINPVKLPLTFSLQLVNEHNDFVVKLVTLRATKKPREFIETLDMYRKHAMMWADAIYEALTY